MHPTLGFKESRGTPVAVVPVFLATPSMLHCSRTVAFKNLLPEVLARGVQTLLLNCGICLFFLCYEGLFWIIPAETRISSRSMLHSGVVRTATLEALIDSKQSE